MWGGLSWAWGIITHNNSAYPSDFLGLDTVQKVDIATSFWKTTGIPRAVALLKTKKCLLCPKLEFCKISIYALLIYQRHVARFRELDNLGVGRCNAGNK